MTSHTYLHSFNTDGQRWNAILKRKQRFLCFTKEHSIKAAGEAVNGLPLVYSGASFVSDAPFDDMVARSVVANGYKCFI